MVFWPEPGGEVLLINNKNMGGNNGYCKEETID